VRPPDGRKCPHRERERKKTKPVMDRIKLVSELYASRLVAVIRSRSAEDALAIAHAAADGGIKFIEITFTVPGALEVIKRFGRTKGCSRWRRDGARATAGGTGDRCGSPNSLYRRLWS
jgi:hypothetical protein